MTTMISLVADNEPNYASHGGVDPITMPPQQWGPQP